MMSDQDSIQTSDCDRKNATRSISVSDCIHFIN